jgi:hypothetical protein
MGKRPRETSLHCTFLQRRHANGQRVSYEEVFTQHHQTSEEYHLSHNEIKPQTCGNGSDQKDKVIRVREDWKEGNPAKCWWDCKFLHGSSENSN